VAGAGHDTSRCQLQKSTRGESSRLRSLTPHSSASLRLLQALANPLVFGVPPPAQGKPAEADRQQPHRRREPGRDQQQEQANCGGGNPANRHPKIRRVSYYQQQDGEEDACGDSYAAQQQQQPQPSSPGYRLHQQHRLPPRPAPCPPAAPPPPPPGYDPDYLAACYEDEKKGAADWRYLSTVQLDVDVHKRLVLVDWLVEVVDEFKLSQPTLFLAVNYVDRYLSRRPVARDALQLLGVTALWLACKLEEVYPPTLGDFVDVTQSSCTAAQLVAMESALLRELGFTLSVPTAVTFLQLYLPAAAANAADADAVLSAAIDGGGEGGGSNGGSGSDGGSDTASAAGALFSPTNSGSSEMSTGASGGLGGGNGGSNNSSSGNLAAAAAAAPFGGGARCPPTADRPTGPRAAPRYPYPVGGPCPALAGGARASSAPLAVAPPGSLSEFPRRLAHMAEYLAELALLNPECLRFPPSLVAAAALQLACSLLDAPPGARARLAPAAAALAAASEERVRACVGELRRMYAYAAAAPKPPAVKVKYCAGARCGVAAAQPPLWALEG
jgi:hypothetical protein